MAKPEEPSGAAAKADNRTDASDSEGVAEDSPGVVFLDPELDEESRAQLEGVLGLAIRVVAPEALEPAFPRVADRAVVVPFQLPTQSGLDLVESLRLREHGSEIPIAMADDEPTRSKVFAALRAGATSFTARPYVAEELRLRLGAALEAGGNPEQTDGNDSADGAEEAEASSQDVAE